MAARRVSKALKCPIRVTATRAQPARGGLVLLAIVALAVTLRVLYTLLEAPWPPVALDDQFYFSALPKLIADGHGFIAPFKYAFDGVVTPTAEHPPLFSSPGRGRGGRGPPASPPPRPSPPAGGGPPRPPTPRRSTRSCSRRRQPWGSTRTTPSGSPAPCSAPAPWPSRSWPAGAWR